MTSRQPGPQVTPKILSKKQTRDILTPVQTLPAKRNLLWEDHSCRQNLQNHSYFANLIERILFVYIFVVCNEASVWMMTKQFQFLKNLVLVVFLRLKAADDALTGANHWAWKLDEPSSMDPTNRSQYGSRQSRALDLWILTLKRAPQLLHIHLDTTLLTNLCAL